MKYVPREMFTDGQYLAAIDSIDFISDNGLIFDGSFHVIGARLMGLSYPDYLRYLRSKGATLKGKTGYTYAYFKDKDKCQKVCDVLNTKAAELTNKMKGKAYV